MPAATVLAARERLACALGYEDHSGLSLGALVAEAERRLAEQDGMIERLKAEARDAVVNPMMHDIPLPEVEA